MIPLETWYPAMAAKWKGTPVPESDREAWVIHHTAGGTNNAPLAYARSVADAHYQKWGVPGGYTALIGTDGIAREMVGLDHLGVHSGTHYWNRHGLALAFQGSFMDKPPSQIMLDGGAKIISLFPLPQTTHRQVRPTYTDCPGDALIRLLPIGDEMTKAEMLEVLTEFFGPAWTPETGPQAGRRFVKANVDSVWHARSDGRSTIETLDSIHAQLERMSDILDRIVPQ